MHWTSFSYFETIHHCIAQVTFEYIIPELIALQKCISMYKCIHTCSEEFHHSLLGFLYLTCKIE